MGDTSVVEIGYSLIREDQYHIISYHLVFQVQYSNLVYGEIDSHRVRNKIKNEYELNGNKNN